MLKTITPPMLYVPPRPTLSPSKVPPPPPPDVTGKSFEFFNQSNCSFPVCCVLLDNKSMANAFIKKSLLNNIRQDRRTLCLIYNSGTVPITLVGYLEEYRMLCYHPKGIPNMLSLPWIKNNYLVTYNIVNGKWFRVQKVNNGTKRFVGPPQGLYWMNTKD